MSRCSLCPGNHRQVFSSGSEESKTLIVSEDPTWADEKYGRPLADKGGSELDNLYLPLAGLKRSDVRVAHVVQCRTERNNVDVKPSDKLAMCCAMNHLPDELLRGDYETLILLGPLACELAGINKLDFEHGIARHVDINSGPFAGFSGLVVPQYAPAAGIHLTRLMQPMIDDWTNLGRVLKNGSTGKIRGNSIVGALPDYRIADNESDIKHYLRRAKTNLGADTETDAGKPYSLQLSVEPGTGIFINNLDGGIVEAVCRYAEEMGLIWIFHNAVFDWDVIEKMGGFVRRLRDTMAEIYHLGNLPQGLKAAVYRIFGHRMTSYDEVVVPHSKRVLEDWLVEALGLVGTEWSTETIHPQGKDCLVCGKRHLKPKSDYIKHEAEGVLQRVLRETAKPGSEYDPWQKPKADKGEIKPRLVGREWMKALEQSIGVLPVPSIVHAPIHEQIAYGCSDADWALRLALWLDKERERIMRDEWNIEAA